jgi:dihydroxyacetone kinase-like protein
MSDLALDSGALRELLRKMATALTEHIEEIRLLDATIGDGDLGVTAGLMSKAMIEFADSSQEADVGRLLMQCGIAINRANPSTFGTIMASGFMGGGKAVAGRTTVDLGDLSAAGKAAVESIMGRGKAAVGDKTMLDALVPAVDALAEGHSNGSGMRAAMRAAALACEQGMEATIGMVAKCGKARVFQEKSVGVQDGGATALHYMMDAAAEHIGAM